MFPRDFLMFQSDNTNPSIPCLAAGFETIFQALQKVVPETLPENLFQALQEVVHIAERYAMLEKLPALQLEHDPC
jgi:hypothetical protein